MDVSGRLRIIEGPERNELTDTVLLNRQLEVVSLTQEGIDDDRDEQVDENLVDEDVEQNKESNGGCRATTLERFSTVLHHALIRLIFTALVII